MKWGPDSLPQTAVRERGYILLMTLLLVAVAAMALVGASRASLDKALQAKNAQRQLQLRWGILSCRTTFLPQAETLLTQVEEESNQPVVTVRVHLTLGEQEFELVIADEQAKVNVNTLYQRHGRETTETSVKRLIRQSADTVRVRLAPLPSSSDPEDSGPDQLPELGSFAQLFPTATPDQLIGTAHEPSAAGAHITFWGGGQLNFRRASRPALKEVCRSLLIDNQIDDLILARQETADLSIAEALNQLGLTKEKTDQLAGLLTDSSGCYSLWITVRDRHRSWYRLDVSESIADNNGADQAQPTDNTEQSTEDTEQTTEDTEQTTEDTEQIVDQVDRAQEDQQVDRTNQASQTHTFAW